MIFLVHLDVVVVVIAARQDEIQQKRQNLDYEEITPCLKEVTKVWDTMLNNPDRKSTQFDPKILEDCIKQGKLNESNLFYYFHSMQIFSSSFDWLFFTKVCVTAGLQDSSKYSR